MKRPQPQTIQIIPASPESAGEMEALARSIWPAYYTPIIGEAQVAYMLEKLQSKGAFLSQMKEGFLYFFLRNPEGNNIGYLSLIPLEKELFLSKFYLVEESRGKGYGRQAMDWMKGFARERLLSKITLTVNKKNPSVKIYQKMGFRITGPTVTDIGSGFVMDDYLMEWAF